MLENVKSYLRISWEDDDELLLGFIERGKEVLNSLSGKELNYEEESTQKALLLDYCRYAYNNATECFEDNFYKEISRLQYQIALEDRRDK